MKKRSALFLLAGLYGNLAAGNTICKSEDSGNSSLLITTIITLCSAVALAIFNSFIQWYSAKTKEKKIKAAELITALATYIDYMITLSWFPIIELRKRKDGDIRKLIELKSDVVRAETLLAAYDFASYQRLNPYVGDALDIDTQISDLILTKSDSEEAEEPAPETKDPDDELDEANEKLRNILSDLKTATANIMK